MTYRQFSEDEIQRWWRIYQRIDGLDRRYRMTRKAGWVYVMRNPAFRDSPLKIGRTKRPPLKRAAELSSSTSVPADFELLYFVHVSDCLAAERWIHDQLATHRRTSRKEFFDAPLGEVVELLDAAAASLPLPGIPQFFEPTVTTCSECGTSNAVKRLMVRVRATCRSCGCELPESK